MKPARNKFHRRHFGVIAQNNRILIAVLHEFRDSGYTLGQYNQGWCALPLRLGRPFL